MTTTSVNDVADELQAALRRRPFEPFAIVTKSGKKLKVTRVAQAATNRIQVAFLGKNEVMTWLKIDEVAGIEWTKQRRAGAGRGKS